MQSVSANANLIASIEALSEAELASIRLAMFGRTLDAAGLLRMRLSEHAVHSWDVAVTFDPAARVAPDAVGLLIDGLQPMMGWMGKKAADPALLAVTTTGPVRSYTLDTGSVTLTPDPADASASGTLELTAEALLRLVYPTFIRPVRTTTATSSRQRVLARRHVASSAVLPACR